MFPLFIFFCEIPIPLSELPLLGFTILPLQLVSRHTAPVTSLNLPCADEDESNSFISRTVHVHFKMIAIKMYYNQFEDNSLGGPRGDIPHHPQPDAALWSSGVTVEDAGWR